MSDDKEVNTPISPAMDAAMVALLGPSYKDINTPKSPNAERGDDELKTKEVRILARDAYAKELYSEDIKIRKWKRWIGIPAAIIAGTIPLIALGITYLALFGNLKEQLPDTMFLSLVLVSASMLSFVVIYGIIIKSTLVSSQQSTDDSNLPARVISEVVRKNVDGE